MQEFKKRIQAVLSYVLTILLIGAYPVATFAEAVPAAIDSPATSATTPAVSTPAPDPKPVYTYDPTTKHWNSDSWQYDTASGQYRPVSTPGPILPTGPKTTPGPVPLTSPASAPTATEIPTDGAPSTSTMSTIGQSLSGDANITNALNGTSNTTALTNNTIGNTIGSTALTGNAAVSSNTTAGNATSGDAAVSETIMNTINSSVASGAAGIANFVSNISGDVHGDILLYPMILGAMLLQSALNPSVTTDVSANATANFDTNNQIINDVNLNATSGTATVDRNTNAGDATSGSANAVANIMNIINSSIAANQSFMGIINIYGNLDGDILIAPDFLAELLGNNSSTTVNQTLNANIANTDTIANNVNLSAASGTATVAKNTNAGDATSGSAATNVVILNLTGHEIVASNSLLVFVNVLGKWVGLIVDAPMGSTAAAVGNGVEQNTTVNLDGTITAQTNNQITNNVTLASQSGDAAVTMNTRAGDATSGNATASANILNMSQSNLALSGWFGVLFINVFGSWLGSFGVDTERGNLQPLAGSTSGTSNTSASQQPQAVQFIPKSTAQGSSSGTSNLIAASSTDNTNSQPPVVQKSAVAGASTASASSKSSTSNLPTSASITAATVLGAVLLLGATIRSLWPLISRRFGALAS
ncbi:hypothetical protein H7X69_02870 [Candidatus Saccharibacteria bacterium]|nr:hypothetical protein [Candidatus Saccharibacteria bacterium]